jgi:hypothetical protein
MPFTYPAPFFMQPHRLTGWTLIALLLGLSSGWTAEAQTRSKPSVPVPVSKVQVVPSALAGEGPYDVILLAVRSRLPFVPKDGGIPIAREVYYAEALCRSNADAGLKLLFNGVPLLVNPNPAYPGNGFLRTATNQIGDAGPPERGVGPQWFSFGTGAVAKYNTAQRTVYPYPHPYVFDPPTMTLSLYHEPERSLYEYKLKYDLNMLAKPPAGRPVGFLSTTDPTGGIFMLGVPKMKQYAAHPAHATRDNEQFTQTMPAGTVLYAGTGAPVPAEVFGIFRAYTLRSETVPHHLPGKRPQKWLFVTVDETAAQLLAQ